MGKNGILSLLTIKSTKTATAELAHIMHITALIFDTEFFILLLPAFINTLVIVNILNLIYNKVNGDL